MATAETGKMQYRQPARWGRNLLLLALVVAIALAAWFWTRMREAALTNSAYTAQTGCLCRFAAGRDIAVCAADSSVTRPWVSLSEDTDTQSVTASVPGLASQMSRWSPATGCVMEPWRD